MWLFPAKGATNAINPGRTSGTSNLGALSGRICPGIPEEESSARNESHRRTLLNSQGHPE